MPNALQISDPNADSDNPLVAGTPTPADAWSYNTSALGDWLTQQRAKSAAMGLWNDQTGLPTATGIVNAGQQYSNALLASTGGPKFARETIPIDGTTNIRVNPSVPEMQRLLDQHNSLRIIRNGENIAVAPSYDTTHDEMFKTLRNSAHPLGDVNNDAWIAHFAGGVIDSNAGGQGVAPSQWPMSLRLLFPQD